MALLFSWASLSDHHLLMGLNYRPVFSHSGCAPRMQELLGGMLGDFLSEGSSYSRKVSRPQSKNTNGHAEDCDPKYV